ncbi:HMCN1 [Symbiodinium sp. CCMP2592]|nr:HMCN1 [Symbiodinium sp. CCMP2592]
MVVVGRTLEAAVEGENKDTMVEVEPEEDEDHLLLQTFVECNEPKGIPGLCEGETDETSHMMTHSFKGLKYQASKYDEDWFEWQQVEVYLPIELGSLAARGAAVGICDHDQSSPCSLYLLTALNHRAHHKRILLMNGKPSKIANRERREEEWMDAIKAKELQEELQREEQAMERYRSMRAREWDDWAIKRTVLTMEVASGSSDTPRVAKILKVPLDEEQGARLVVELKVANEETGEDAETQVLPGTAVLPASNEMADLTNAVDKGSVPDSSEAPTLMMAGVQESPPGIPPDLTMEDYRMIFAEWEQGDLTDRQVRDKYGEALLELFQTQHIAYMESREESTLDLLGIGPMMATSAERVTPCTRDPGAEEDQQEQAGLDVCDPGAGIKKGAPEMESMRQGQFRSPWTNQVYDRWAPEDNKQLKTDRQGGLARARAFQTPTQRQIQTAVEEREADNTPEWKKFYPGLAPVYTLPKNQRQTGAQTNVFERHAFRAGNFGDIFKQTIVQTVVDLKVNKKDAASPVWYVEPCGGEGEYHVQRMRSEMDDRKPMKWPTAEDLYSVLEKEDLTYMPMEVKGWMDSVKLLNFNENMDWEVKGEGAMEAEEQQGIQWLPSSTLVATRLLRKQDPVTIWEDNRAAFAAMFNFVRNWSSQLDPHVELIFKDGLKHTHRRWVQRRPGSISEAFGKQKGQRGVVFIDPDYTRGGEAERCHAIVVDLWKHWRSATVMVTYPIGPKYEKKARDFNRKLRQADKTLDLLTIEAYVENKDWHENSEEDKWRGYGVLISQAPGTTAERAQAALKVICDALATMPEAHPMHIRIERL